MHVASRYGRVEDLLADLSLDPPRHARDAGPAGADDERPVTLSTIHSAKGLEWRDVYVIGLADGRFPSGRSLGDPETLEEEQRLLYVAVTRARRRLTLSAHSGPCGVFDRLCRFVDRPDVLATLNQATVGPDTAEDDPGIGPSKAHRVPSLNREQLLSQLQAIHSEAAGSSVTSLGPASQASLEGLPDLEMDQADVDHAESVECDMGYPY